MRNDSGIRFLLEGRMPNLWAKVSREVKMNMIIWLEDPRKYRYLREQTSFRGSRRGFNQDAKLDFGDFYKLIGYELKEHTDSGNFIYRVFWLQTCDDGCPDVERNKEFGGFPCEGKFVKDLLKEDLNKEVRCLECTQLGSKKDLCDTRRIEQSEGKSVAPCKAFVPVDKKYEIPDKEAIQKFIQQ